MTKVTTLDCAVASIPSGSHLALSGFAITRGCMAFAREVIRQGIKGLTISQCVGAMDADLLVGAGTVERIIYGGGSLDRFGRLACINRGIEDRTLAAEEYSSLSIAFRYLAGSLGLPFIPIRSLCASDLLKQIKEHSTQEVAEVIDPFTDEKWTVLKPLRPDIAVIQVQIADEEGNAVIIGPRWDNAEQARASQRTIVITEHVVPSDRMRRQPERTVIPGLLVSHVVELPFSAHPTSVYLEYDYDAPQIQAYVEATCNPDMLPGYLEKTVFDIANHNQYLEKIVGLERLEDLRADSILGY